MPTHPLSISITDARRNAHSSANTSLWSVGKTVAYAPGFSPPRLLDTLKAEHRMSSLFYRIGLFAHIQQHSPAKATTSYLGRHILTEASWPIGHCSITALLAALKAAVDNSGVTRLKDYAQQFEDQSFIAAVVIQESHIILHGYPDGRLVLDAYTCGEADPQWIIVELCKRLPITLHQSQVLTRGLYEPSSEGGWCSDPSTMRLGLENDIPLHPELTLMPADEADSTGWHGIAEFYGCNSSTINSAESMSQIFQDIAHSLDIDVLKEYHHEFSPQGLSIAFIGKGFHLTMHSWPELYYAPIDIYCARHCDVSHLLQALKEAIAAQHMICTIQDRGNLCPIQCRR